MHWVIQHNLWNETGWRQMMDVIERLKISYTVVKVIPFIHELIPDDLDLWGKPVYVQGGTSLSLVARRKGWSPGTFLNENHNFMVWAKKYKEHCLNYDAEIMPFEQVCIPEEFVRFIRPVEDNKSFAGTIMRGNEFAGWKKAVMGLNEELAPLRPETMVLVARPQDIAAEYRLFIVDGRVVTATQYRVGDIENGRVVKKRIGRHHPAWKFCKRMIEIYQPARAFVMDVCRMEDKDPAFMENTYDIQNPWRIIEINNINSSGFYDIDVEAYVKAIERMRFEPL